MYAETLNFSLRQAYIARIDEVNLQGPTLRAVIEINPSALIQAAALDKERQLKGPRGPLHGIPIIVKDNIATLHSEGLCLISLTTRLERLISDFNP